MRTKTTISDSDLDADFEYNFDVTPFNYVLEGIHRLITTPYHLGSRLNQAIANWLHIIRKEKRWRRTFKGPASILR